MAINHCCAAWALPGAPAHCSTAQSWGQPGMAANASGVQEDREQESQNAESSSCSDIPPQPLQDSQRVPEHPNTNQKDPVSLIFVSLHPYPAILLSLWKSSLFSCSGFLWQAVIVLPSRSTILDWGGPRKGHREWGIENIILFTLICYFYLYSSSLLSSLVLY